MKLARPKVMARAFVFSSFVDFALQIGFFLLEALDSQPHCLLSSGKKQWLLLVSLAEILE